MANFDFPNSNNQAQSTFTTSANMSNPSPSAPATSGPAIGSLPSANVAEFVEKTCSALNMPADQRAELRAFARLCTSLGAAAHASVYQQAMLIAINARALVLENMLRRTEMSIAQLKAAAMHKTDLEEAQKTEMGLICRRVVWNAKRFDFSNESIAGDAWKLLEEGKNENNWFAFFTQRRSATLEKNADHAMSERCSTAKNALRIILLEYTVGESAQSLTRATTIAAKRLGGITDITKITSEDMLRMLWLRHFFRQKFLELKPKGRGAQSKRKRTTDAEDDMSGNEDELVDPKKAPPPAPGSDFFSILMKPILEKFATLGNPKSASYQEYVDDLIDKELELFPNDKMLHLPLANRRVAVATSASDISPLASIIASSTRSSTNPSAGASPGAHSIQSLMNPAAGSPVPLGPNVNTNTQLGMASNAAYSQTQVPTSSGPSQPTTHGGFMNMPTNSSYSNLYGPGAYNFAEHGFGQ
ncbi:hypothetical protein EV122DRAFT_282223 [Schizophyllum commune]